VRMLLSCGLECLDGYFCGPKGKSARRGHLQTRAQLGKRSTVTSSTNNHEDSLLDSACACVRVCARALDCTCNHRDVRWALLDRRHAPLICAFIRNTQYFTIDCQNATAASGPQGQIARRWATQLTEKHLWDDREPPDRSLVDHLTTGVYACVQGGWGAISLRCVRIPDVYHR
jgi:hypothetical protein